MLAKRTVAIAASLAAVAGGSAVAIAATVNEEAKRAEAEVLGDAAKQLGVQSDDLRKALADALDAQLDKAVKAGDLTQAQADAIKRRRAESGTILPGPGLRPGLHRRHGGPGGRHATLAAAAKALGLTGAQLHEQMHDGKTIAEIAQARSKDLADVKAAMKKAITDRLAAEVKAGRLTDAQRDEIAAGLDARIDDKVNRKIGAGGPGRRGGRGFRLRGGPPPAPPRSGTAPGSAPAPAPGGDLAPA